MKFANTDKDIVRFMRANSYMEISVYKLSPSGVELLDGSDFQVAK